MATYKPFLFIKSVVVWGEDADDAADHLQTALSDMGGDIYDDWEYSDESETPEFIDAMGGEVEVED